MILITIKTGALIFLFLALACFSLSETAIISLNKGYLKQLKNRRKLSRSASFIEKRSDEAITAMVVGLNLSVIGIGVLSASIIMDLGYKGFKQDFLFPALTILAALIIGNIFPKTFARYNAQKAAPFVLPFVHFCAKCFMPIVKVLSKLANKLIRRISKSKEDQTVKAEDIDFLLSNETTSPLSDDSRQIAGNIMDFAEIRVSQVMTPRSELFAVDIEQSRQTIIRSIIDSQYSRVPVYKKHLNAVVGIIYSKDLALSWRNSDIIILEDLIRPVYYVPESAKVNVVLKEFKSGRRHLAVVVDEFGLTVGIVSIEDLLEEIVGEVLDEYDKEEKHIITYGHYGHLRHLIDAQESVLDVNEKIGIEIPDGDYSTIGGWVLSLFGKIPKAGEKIYWQNFRIEIERADKKQIHKILLEAKKNKKSDD